MFKQSWLITAAFVVCLGVTAAAQVEEPFVRLDFHVNPDCPFDCDTITLVVDGELSSVAWSEPVLLDWTRDGNQITVRIETIFTDQTLPVTRPITLAIPIGTLPEEAYDVRYLVFAGNPIATMPPIPMIFDRSFRVAPPGDLNCDGVGNVLDVVTLIGPIFWNWPTPDPARRADINGNGVLDVLDVVALIVYVFRNGDLRDPCTAQGTSVVGAWEWLWSDGGIAGMHLTPEMTGYTQTFVYFPDGTFQYYRNAALFEETTYIAAMELHSWFLPDSILTVTYGTSMLEPQAVIEVSPDTLRLADLVYDGFTWTFVRAISSPAIRDAIMR